jgi:3-hydroxyacyl-[acyl-carrier-protein] dehydratase
MPPPDNVLEGPLSAAELMRFLPHRPPFLFLKKLLEWVPGARALGEVEFDGSEEFFRGHFPGKPIVPGVILIEAAAQTAGIALARDLSDSPAASGGLPALAKVKSFRFRAPARPREKLLVEAVVTSRLGNTGSVSAAVRRADACVAEGDLLLALAPA